MDPSLASSSKRVIQPGVQTFSIQDPPQKESFRPSRRFISPVYGDQAAGTAYNGSVLYLPSRRRLEPATDDPTSMKPSRASPANAASNVALQRRRRVAGHQDTTWRISESDPPAPPAGTVTHAAAPLPPGVPSAPIAAKPGIRSGGSGTAAAAVSTERRQKLLVRACWRQDMESGSYDRPRLCRAPVAQNLSLPRREAKRHIETAPSGEVAERGRRVFPGAASTRPW
eukprot:TRINITY_DN21200_c0_g1_i1.p1 TRINITY_DN21200_c0_g1~~TRINITY_DN21200_c0_g1_i1.p1  ORF type:complete len:227 (-),score=10.38 TRINITY_DN21200_c0_g1_i1:44-724(-)